MRNTLHTATRIRKHPKQLPTRTCAHMRLALGAWRLQILLNINPPTVSPVESRLQENVKRKDIPAAC